jgi:hypothetical protein
VHELGDGRHILFTHGNGRHALLGARTAHDREDEFAMLIVQHDLRTEKVRTT